MSVPKLLAPDSSMPEGRGKTVPTGWLYDLTKGGQIPHYRIGGSVLFDPHEVKEWMTPTYWQHNLGIPYLLRVDRRSATRSVNPP